MLPKFNGYEVCNTLRMQKSDIFVILLTAKEEDNDKLLGLGSGADN